MGEPALGIITTHHYSAAHDSPENSEFLKTYLEVSGGKRTTYCLRWRLPEQAS